LLQPLYFLERSNLGSGFTQPLSCKFTLLNSFTDCSDNTFKLVVDRRKQKVVRASVQGIDGRLLNRAVSHRRARIMADRLLQDQFSWSLGPVLVPVDAHSV